MRLPCFAFLLAAGLATGCGKSGPKIVAIPDPHVSVIDSSGVKRTIPSADLYDSGTGRHTVDSVLVVDRSTNQQVYVNMDQLPTESQADARYILVTQDPPGSPSPQAEHP